MTILYKRIGDCKWESEMAVVDTPHADKTNSQQFLRNNDNESHQNNIIKNSIITKEENNECWDFMTPSKVRSNTDSTLDTTYDTETDESAVLYAAQEEEDDDAELLEQNKINNCLGPKLKIDEMEIEQSTIQSHVNHYPSDNLQHSVTYDMNIGFQRLRRIMLSTKSDFWIERLTKDELNNTDVSRTEWDHHDSQIGLPSSSTKLEDNQEEQKQFMGAQRKTSYRLPKSLFIPSTMGYDVTTIINYDNHKFTFRTATKTPKVPFGNRIVTHSQIVVLNKGFNKTRMICSMEVEFPLGPPLGFANKIREAAKASTMSFFHSMQKTVSKFVEMEEQEEIEKN